MTRSPAAVAAVGLLAVAAAGWFAYQRTRPNVAGGTKLELSGVALGMSMHDYRRATSLRRFEIAGVTGSPRAVFVEEKLNRFDWRFPARSYEAVRDAIRTKYPELKCGPATSGDAGREVCSVGTGLLISYGADEPQGQGWTSMVVLQREAALPSPRR